MEIPILYRDYYVKFFLVIKECSVFHYICNRWGLFYGNDNLWQREMYVIYYKDV